MIKILSLDSFNNIPITARWINQDTFKDMETKNAIIDILNVEKVPDVHRYNLFYENWDWQLVWLEEWEIHDSNFNDLLVNNINSNNQKTIVLILESPHKEEFQYYDINGNIINNWAIENIHAIKPISPAQWATGSMIYEKFEIIFKQIENQLSENELYKIIIANPIPYQTSLHSLHGKSLKSSYATLRNNIWNHLWNIPKIRNNFLERLIQYKTDIVVNLCTTWVRTKVENTICWWIDSKQIHTKYTTESHPSSWVYRKI